jgi:lipoprotein-anchoring transpeptidase ErfK/SrfK
MPPPVKLPGRTRLTLLASALALVALPAAGARAATDVSVNVKGGGQIPILKNAEITGKLTNPAPNDKVQVTVTVGGDTVLSEKLDPKGDGSFSLPLTVEKCCRYVVTAENGTKKATDSFRVELPKRLGNGPATALFNRSLQAQGYHTGTKGPRVTIGTRLAIKAFRKVNGMPWRFSYRRSIFAKLLEGEGAFKPRYNDGRHVEVDISKQTMSLIEGDKPVHTFHVSTGAPSTPTIRGKFRFYMKQPGYNGKRMYFSVYFRGGYATHGYSSVPNYNASHGCVRNPIPFSRFIYNWVEIGMPIYVYG